VGRAPMGSPRRADLVPQHEGFEPPRGLLQLLPGLCPCPAQIAAGCIVDGGPIPRREVPGAPPPGQWPGVTTVGCDPVARRFGKPGGGDDPAAVAVVRQVARAPEVAGVSCVDADEGRPLLLPRPQLLIKIARPGRDGAAGDHRGPVCLGDVGDRDGLFLDIHADGECARL
jgi:hypothetical protein